MEEFVLKKRKHTKSDVKKWYGAARKRLEQRYREDPEFREKDLERKRNYHRENRERDNNRSREYYFRKRLEEFGMTLEEYESILHWQNGKCAICRGDQKTKNVVRFCLDHNHKTGEFRGLVCANCNSGLGMFNDNPVILRFAHSYLMKSKRSSKELNV